MSDEAERQRIARLEWDLTRMSEDREREAKEVKTKEEKLEKRILALERQGYYAKVGVGVAVFIGMVASWWLDINSFLRGFGK
jgi:hypothetical protein